jgi:hypothetical protein
VQEACRVGGKEEPGVAEEEAPAATAQEVLVEGEMAAAAVARQHLN